MIGRYRNLVILLPVELYDLIARKAVIYFVKRFFLAPCEYLYLVVLGLILIICA